MKQGTNQEPKAPTGRHVGAAGHISAGGWRRLAIGASALALVLTGVVLWQLTQTSAVDAEVVVVELRAAEGREASIEPSGARSVPRVERARRLALVLVPPAPPSGNEFRLTLFDESERAVLGVDGLSPSASGTFALLLRTAVLRAGDYRIALEQRTRDSNTGAADDWQGLGEYLFRLEGRG